MLRRANHGFIDCVSKVLELVYGRKGKRRHDLMRGLNRQFVETPEEALKRPPDIISKMLAEHPTPLTGEQQLAIPRLTWAESALYQSQKQIRRHEWSRSQSIKPSAGPLIPHLNLWNRRMPAKRVKNLARQKYNDFAQKLWAPLPSDQMEELEAKAKRGAGFVPVPRRPLVGVHIPDLAEDVLHSELHLIHRPRHASGKDREHRVTRRFMRRRYQDIVLKTPTIRFDDQRGKLKVTWPIPQQVPLGPSSSRFQEALDQLS